MTTLLLGSSGGNYPPGNDIRFEKMLGEWLTGVVDEWIDGVSGNSIIAPVEFRNANVSKPRQGRLNLDRPKGCRQTKPGSIEPAPVTYRPGESAGWKLIQDIFFDRIANKLGVALQAHLFQNADPVGAHAAHAQGKLLGDAG